jgi:hypothetical protein
LVHFATHFCLEFLFNIAYAFAEDDEGAKLEQNESLISVLDPNDDFCAELYLKGVGHGQCEDIY